MKILCPKCGNEKIKRICIIPLSGISNCADIEILQCEICNKVIRITHP